MEKLFSLREEYGDRELSENGAEAHPLDQFSKWFDEAIQAGITEPNAMILSTASADGMPSSRIVLLKVYDKQGFTFFTNYTSRKALELEDNPRAALLFPWHAMERQIRIAGRVEKVSNEESDEYFQSRPPGSRIGAWASPQSQVIPSRDHLEKLEAELRDRFDAGSIPRPPYWGGYRLTPFSMEFWQGRESRLHDRIEYYLDQDNWKMRRLAP